MFPNPILFCVVDGEPMQKFMNKRGLRQMAPISPLIFILGIPNPTTKVRLGHLHTYKLGGMDLVFHLLYCDDILVFGQGNARSMEDIKEVLGVFSAFSGMEVNTLKNRIVYSKSCINTVELERRIHIPLSTFPIRYLGLPLKVGNLKHWDCNELLGKLEAILSMYAARWLLYTS